MMIDAEKLNELSQILQSIPGDFGRNMITVTFYPRMASGCFNFQFNWKCENGEIEFSSLDEAIEKVGRLAERARKYSG